MDTEKLKQLRIELERDQAKWRVEKATTERAVIKAHHELESLKEKLEPQRSLNLSLERDSRVLRKVSADLLKEIGDRRHEVEDLSTQSTALSTEIEALSQQLEDRKAEISGKLSEYHQTVERDYQLKLNIILNTLDKTERQVTTAENKLQMLKLSINDHQDAQKAAETWLADYKKKADDEHRAIIEETNDLQRSRQRLIDENSGLMGQQLALKQQNRELAKQNEGFKAYEDKAWAILKAKDRVLQDKELKLREMEQITPVKRSFLPPIEP